MHDSRLFRKSIRTKQERHHRPDRFYKLTSEDFVNKGSYCPTHQTPSERLIDYMDYMNEFVTTFGKKCIEMIHAAGKKAYMFYDDHLVGTEPYGDRYKDFGFDGLIKAVFNAFETRVCSGVKGVETKELRLHPYLFPTGLKGEPVFLPGGDPSYETKRFWADVRRGLLREPVDRIGMGGYLHLTEPFPDFIQTVKELNDEFRMICDFHKDGKPYVAPVKVAILTAWGKLRSWDYVGHFIHGMMLNELTESIASMPVDVSFINFQDIAKDGISPDVQVIVNAGIADSAWVGQRHWKNETVIEKITDFIAGGGGFLGVGEPSAIHDRCQYFQLANILGLDRETGRSLGMGRRKYSKVDQHFILEDLGGDIDFGNDTDNIFILSNETQVLADKENSPKIAVNEYKKGRSVYLSGFKFTPQNTRILHRTLCWAAKKENAYKPWTSANINTECAYYPNSGKLVVVNNSDNDQKTNVYDTNEKSHSVTLEPYGIKVIEL